MKENLPQEERKKISAEHFKKVFLANSDEAFESYKKLHKDLRGSTIYRLTAQEISEKTKGIAPGNSEKKYTAVFDVEIIGDIKIEDLQDNVEYPLFCFNSKIGNIDFSGDDHHIESWVFNNCAIESIKLRGVNLNDLIVENKTTLGEITIEKGKAKNLNFHGCVSSSILLNDVDIFSLKIYDRSEFKNVLLENESIINDLAIKSSSITQSIYCSNSKIITLSITDNCSVAGILSNSSCRILQFSISKSQVHLIDLKGSEIGNFRAIQSQIKSVLIYKTKISYTLTFNGCWVDDLIHIRNNSEVGKIYLYYSTVCGFNFSRSKIGYVKSSSSLAGGITVGKCTCGNIIIDDKCKIGDIIIEKSNIEYLEAKRQYGSMVFTGSEIPLVVLDECYIPRFDISMGAKLEAYISGGQVNSITFSKSSLSNNSLISFSGCKIYSLIFEEFSVLGRLFFRKIQFAEQPFEWWDEDEKSLKEKYSSIGDILFQGIKRSYLRNLNEFLNKFPHPTIRIAHSSLGSTEFTNSPLGAFRFEFNNSKIKNCFISGGTEPSENIVIIDDDGKPLEKNAKETHVQKVSIYNQFKKIFEAQGDTYRAAQFQAKWAEYQKIVLEQAFKEEKNSCNIWKIIKHLKNDKAQDISIFWFNQKSNKHGEDWLQAVKFLLLVSVPTYLLFLFLAGHLYFGGDFDSSFIGYYFDFLNPVRKSNFIDGMHVPWCAKVVDFFARILIAYGIYQFIAAFRKHGRKK